MANSTNDPWYRRLTQSLRAIQGLAEGTAKAVIILLILASMLVLGWFSDPGRTKLVPFADRILSWSFVVFSVGLAELFVLFVILSVLGRIDLAQAFYEKDGETTEQPAANPPPNDGAAGGASEPMPKTDSAAPPTAASDAKAPKKTRNRLPPSPVSLSRLQAFMWTLVVMTVYFHRVVRDGEAKSLPPIPPELLMVMGISGAVYLASKGISASKAEPEKK